MTSAVLLFGVLAGLDNVRVCSSIGLLPISARKMRLLAASFVFCEMVAPVLGLVAGQGVLALFSPYALAIAPLMAVFCGVAVLVNAMRGNEEGDARKESPLLFALPVSLSLDNVVAGAGFSPLVRPVWSAALTIGLISAAMSCAGLYGTVWLRRLFRLLRSTPVELLMGAYLCVLALCMLVDRT